MFSIASTPTTALAATAVTLTASPTCTTAIPDHNGYVPPTACNANYGFYPEWKDNMAFAIAFGLVTSVHLAQAVVLKKPFCWVIIMGALWECLCFVLRALGAKDQQQSTYVVLSSLLLLLAPLWINAFVYMVVARLAHMLHPQKKISRIPARWLAKAFVAADIISFFIQAAGGGLMAGQNNPGNARLGQKIYMAGVSVQLAFVAIFIVLTAVFHRDFKRNVRTGMVCSPSRWTNALVWVVYTVLVLITWRIIFRLVEFSQGASSSNPILRHEGFQLFLDALPMLLALTALALVHPGIVLIGSESKLPPSKIKWWHGRGIAFELLEVPTPGH